MTLPCQRIQVQVLLATHNGLPWLDDQIDSIFGQTGVDIRLLVSDDASTDGTRERLLEWARDDARITLLPDHPRLGNAAFNFYHLLAHADVEGCGLFALADQDDIWEPDKLWRHARLIESEDVDGISSDVTAFWPNGRARLIRKSQPQRRWDHMLEPPGPGCTFLITARLVREVNAWLVRLAGLGIGPLPKHDWFIYLIARCTGLRWYIDPTSTVRYRQHGRNEVGANAGIRPKIRRIRMLVRGGYQRQVRHAMTIGRIVSSQARTAALPPHFDFMTLLRHGRRRPHEAFLVALFAFGRL